MITGYIDKCDRCGKVADTFHVDKTQYICEICKYIMDPPVLVVVETPYRNKQLYNPAAVKYELSMTMEKFIRCGWFIRRKKINRDVTTFVLEYHGDLKCKRCSGWEQRNDFPFSFRTCASQICNNYITKKEIPKEEYI